MRTREKIMQEEGVSLGLAEAIQASERVSRTPESAGSLAQLEKYENLLFKMGAMNQAPCFKCGYNGPGYFQPSTHKCAEKHHRLYEEQ